VGEVFLVAFLFAQPRVVVDDPVPELDVVGDLLVEGCRLYRWVPEFASHGDQVAEPEPDVPAVLVVGGVRQFADEGRHIGERCALVLGGDVPHAVAAHRPVSAQLDVVVDAGQPVFGVDHVADAFLRPVQVPLAEVAVVSVIVASVRPRVEGFLGVPQVPPLVAFDVAQHGPV